MDKNLRNTLILAGVCGLSWYLGMELMIGDFEIIFYVLALLCGILAVSFLLIWIIGKVKGSVNGFKVVALVDSLVAIAAGLYAIYDINFTYGWFAGLLGVLLLMFVEPVCVVILIGDVILWKRKQKKLREEQQATVSEDVVAKYFKR